MVMPNTPHTTTGLETAELLLGRRPKTLLDLVKPNLTDCALKTDKTQDRPRPFSNDRIFPWTTIVRLKFWLGSTMASSTDHIPTGPFLIYMQRVNNKIWRRNQDHLKLRYSSPTDNGDTTLTNQGEPLAPVRDRL